MGISRVFDIARRSLSVYQKALDVTANNVANSSNTSYSRQEAVLQASTPQTFGGFVWGTGVTISEIVRARDTYVDTQVRTNYQKQGDSNLQSDILSQIEELLTEPSEDGLGNYITEFLDSWSELGVNPSSTTLRNNVLDTANQLSTKIQTLYDSLSEIKASTVSDFNNSIVTLNDDLEQIQVLNQQIYTASVSGASANDLMDQRDELLDEISSIANVTISYDDGGSALVSIGGILAADRTSSTEFTSSISNGELQLVTAEDGQKAVINSGELNALSTMYSDKIPEYLSDIDEVVTTLMNSVNELHSAGYSNTDPTQTGINFFSSYSSGTLTVNEEIVNNANMIAASADGTEGNGDIANDISGLVSEDLIDGQTISEKYSELVNNIASEKSSQEGLGEAYDLVVSQLEEQRSSVSGVSLDDEMTNMIIYQRSYDASAQLITTANEMLQTLIDMV